MASKTQLSSTPLIETMRHSCAHVMAAAIQILFPQAQFGVGPVVENGFYYDVKLPRSLKPDDLQKIETVMRSLIAAGKSFERQLMPIDEAIVYFKKHHQPFKVELLNDLKERGTTTLNDEEQFIVGEKVEKASVYTTGSFVDLCRGPHVATASEIGAFKLTSIAGAYWRGNEKNEMLQRIYGVAFPTQKELDAFLVLQEELVRRDHRKLGKDLELFTFSDAVGAGLALWLPNGTIIREELEKLAKEEEWKDGYVRVATPHLTRGSLYVQSGHLPYYKDSMYPPLKLDDEEYYVKPMNCPHHHQIYLSKRRSYRELPLRVAEYGTVYRYEKSGELNGLLRVRGMTMNDAHIYCRKEQIKEEFMKVMKLHARIYRVFGIKEFTMRLSSWDPAKKGKYIDQPESWNYSQDMMREAMKESGFPFLEVKDEAAFYGPKIDFIIKSVLGTEYAISTNQLDFAAGERFQLRHIGEDGKEYTVFVIHRAPLGTHERFVAFLLEHYGGAFPVWLAPIQVGLIPVGEGHVAFATKLQKALRQDHIRAELMDQNETVGYKIRRAEKLRLPYTLVVGDKEKSSKKLAVRVRGQKKLLTMTLAKFIGRVKEETEKRK